jgi:hypothetical protein
LIRQFLLDCIEQGAVHDRRLRAGQDVALVSDLADIEPVAQEIEQASPLERDATAGAAQPCLGADVTLLEISNQGIDAAKFEIAPKDQSDLFGLTLDNGDLALLHVVAEREGTADPESLALGRCDLVPDPLGCDLSLELSKGQQHIERQPAHRGRGVELLGDRDKGHAVGIEEFDQFGEVGKRPRQPVYLVDDDDVDLVGTDVVQQSLEVRPVGRPTRVAAVIIACLDQSPAGMDLALDIG